MTTPQPSGRPATRTLQRLGGFVGMGLVAICSMQHTFRVNSTVVDGDVNNLEYGPLAVLGVGAVIGLLILMRRRNRMPMKYLLIAASAGIAFSITPLAALVGLPALFRRSTRDAVLGSVIVTVCLVIWAVQDYFAATMRQSTLQQFVAPRDFPELERFELPLGSVILAVVVPLAIALATAMVQRERGEKQDAQQQTRMLDAELARKMEHERMAQEIHDVIGHRLSLINLQAGAIEALDPDDPRFEQQLTLLRENASNAMHDLRSALNVAGAPAAPIDLSDLQSIIEDSTETQQHVNSNVYLRNPEDAPDELARAVVRIVQEIMTNSRKHAPDSLLRLQVSGGPDDGIHILGRNAIATDAVAGVDTRGLIGMEERAKSLGGTFIAGVEHGEFVVRVDLPWQTPRRFLSFGNR
ncbi:sensor histidine kinase [Gulosibacter bifidus]|uniref:histidine kinase n=1 Tax=Gulosibacter bifidus TaxID=272239 RepID=A0ABW5RK75_9MICO|nr:histidine kinase [Gulosibacter bifidus]